MELKETKNLPTSVGKNGSPRSEKNDSDDHRVDDILFPVIEDGSDPSSVKDEAQKYHEQPLFRSVSTLDWLNTWRPLEIS